MTSCNFAFALPFACGPFQSHSFEQIRHARDLCAGSPRLWIGSGTPVIDLGAAGVIIGILFSKTSSARLKSLPSNAPDRANSKCLASWLVRECWGAYVAILTGLQADGAQILVDPSGLLPAYGTDTGTHYLVVSSPDLIEQVTGERPQPCWPATQAHLARPDLRQRSTCLKQVSEFGRGELTIVGDKVSVSATLWSPQIFMPAGNSRSCGDVAEELQAITTMVVGAIAEVTLPAFASLVGGCKLPDAAHRIVDCRAVGAAMRNGDTILVQAVGIAVSRGVVAAGSAEEQQLNVEKRRLDWQHEQASRYNER